MTDALHGDVPTMTSGADIRCRNPYVRSQFVFGLWMAIGGLIGGLAAKASADHAALVASSPEEARE